MNWLARLFGSNARRDAVGDPARVQEVEAVLDELRPMLAMDGGNFELVSVDGDVVTLHAVGACAGCHAQATTLSAAIETRLRERCHWLHAVRTV